MSLPSPERAVLLGFSPIPVLWMFYQDEAGCTNIWQNATFPKLLCDTSSRCDT